MDALDRQILIALQQDGSLTNAHLAQRLGLSQSAMSERVRRLEQDGDIAGYRALAPEAWARPAGVRRGSTQPPQPESIE